MNTFEQATQGTKLAHCCRDAAGFFGSAGVAFGFAAATGARGRPATGATGPRGRRSGRIASLKSFVSFALESESTKFCVEKWSSYVTLAHSDLGHEIVSLEIKKLRVRTVYWLATTLCFPSTTSFTTLFSAEFALPSMPRVLQASCWSKITQSSNT